ncbi:MAG: YggS family pyridoxal phosphate-dependent enzyme [Muribaculaceae bacterium]|nr:YggS family pyridoxal phosphate-dependent enzyme [Muribaculaceae bacterium]
MNDNIAANLRRIRSTLPEGVELTAVSKFHPVSALMQAYDAGQRAFGESRVQELLAKIPQMPADVRWHFIGHLQTNKVRQLIGHVSLIESIDSERLLRLVDAESERAGVVTRVLLQVHVALEETKFGFYPDEIVEWMSRGGYRTLQATHLCGIMGMASNTDDTARVDADFALLSRTMDRIKEACGSELCGFDRLSMGMSHDYISAIRHGSNMVRIGTDIFGEREY